MIMESNSYHNLPLSSIATEYYPFSPRSATKVQLDGPAHPVPQDVLQDLADCYGYVAEIVAEIGRPRRTTTEKDGLLGQPPEGGSRAKAEGFLPRPLALQDASVLPSFTLAAFSPRTAQSGGCSSGPVSPSRTESTLPPAA
jgi:hypothetical protein